MPTAGRFGRQLSSLLWRSSVDDEVAAELDFHVAMLTRELVEQGMPERAARAEALSRFGDIQQVHTTCRRIGSQREREMRRTEYYAELRQDVAYALRQLTRSPAFTAVAVLTLALGIGATTAIFSAVRSVVLRPFPFAHPKRVMIVSEWFKEDHGDVSDGNFVDWQAAATSFAELAAERYASFNLAGEESPERVFGGRVTHNFFAVFGIQPLLGRTFLPEEDAPGRNQVAVLSQTLWTNRFGADPGVVGRPIRLGGREYTVVGVMPERFDPGLAEEQLWVPIAFTPERRTEHDEHHLFVAGLLKPGVTREQAEAELKRIMTVLAERYPIDNGERSARVRPLDTVLVGDYRQRLLVMLGAVAFVLLIACGNVANLLLARGAARAREIAIRASLGAGRARIVRQLLTESAVLALLAAVGGLALAHAGVRLLVASAPEGIPRLDETHVDWTVLAFTLGLGLVSSVVFGLVPALRAARYDVQSTLRDGGRGTGAAPARDAVRSGLVAAQVALAFTLLVGAGLLVRSALYLQTVRPGFDPGGVVAARLALPQETYSEPARVARTFTQLAEQLSAAPGVRAAAVVSGAPLGPGGGSNGLIPEGRAVEARSTIESRLRMITPGYFAALRVPIVRGRGFNAQDVAGAPRVMIVSEELARRAWPGADPIGKRMLCCEGSPEDPRWKTVVGVAADVRSRGPAAEVTPEFYMPLEQMPPEAWEWVQRTMTVVARGPGGVAPVTTAMRAVVAKMDPSIPLYGVTTMEEALRGSTAQTRFNTLLLGLLSGVGLVLAAVGIYSVIAYFVSLRQQEIGIRMALGATPRDVLALMTWQGVRPVLAGLLLGAAGALATTRLLRGSVYGVSVTDPLTAVGVLALLLAVALVATLVPARRATRVSPGEALQSA